MNGSSLSRGVLRFTERLRNEDVNLYGFLLSVSGKQIAGAYCPPFREGQPHRLYSVSKTFTGIAVGMLAEDGLLSLDQPVAGFFRDWLPEDPSPFLLRLTLRDMLRMATCYRRTAYREGTDVNWAKAFFTGSPDHEPGTVFAYDTGCSQVLAALVKRVSGLEVIDFLRSNGYDVWIVSACEREVARALVSLLGIPFDHVVATDVPYVASGNEAGTVADEYNMGRDEKIVLGGP